MTVVIGSRWRHKYQPAMWAVVVATMEWHDEKYIIYEKGAKRLLTVLCIKSLKDFTRLYQHPDPIGDVP